MRYTHYTCITRLCSTLAWAAGAAAANAACGSQHAKRATDKSIVTGSHARPAWATDRSTIHAVSNTWPACGSRCARLLVRADADQRGRQGLRFRGRARVSHGMSTRQSRTMSSGVCGHPHALLRLRGGRDVSLCSQSVVELNRRAEQCGDEVLVGTGRRPPGSTACWSVPARADSAMRSWVV